MAQVEVAGSQASLFRRPESFARRGNEVVRTVAAASGAKNRTALRAAPQPGEELAGAYDRAWLRSPRRPDGPASGELRVADLFAGCGGLTLGLQEAGRALGVRVRPTFANDTVDSALTVYKLNFPEAGVVRAPIESLLDGEIGKRPTSSERRLMREVGEIDLVVGGPPCQGNSDLNNRTRRNDPKNELYMKMARFCELFSPSSVVIENVPGVLHDSGQVAQRTWAQLERLGYSLSSGVLDAQHLGAAQRRKRNITLGSKNVVPDLRMLRESLEVPTRSVEWAIADLCDVLSDTDFDSPPSPRPESKSRIDYLFDNNLYDLPDELRPDCHRLKTHTYKSMYGRMHWDRPAQTITTGFGVMGRGRFVHPLRRRTLTPHEAARLQGFPDFFSFGTANRTTLHMLIGNAVPSKLGYAIGIHLLA